MKTLTALLVVIVLVILGLALIGCQDARRHWAYARIDHPDGRIERRFEGEVVNSTTSLGELEVQTEDGTLIRLTDLTAEERVSATNAAAINLADRALQKIP